MSHQRKEIDTMSNRCLKWFVIILISLLSIACGNTRKSINDAQNIPSVVISNVTVIDTHSGTKATRDILIQGGLIVDIQPHGALARQYRQGSKNVTLIDASERYAIPGLWDMHVHMNYLMELPADWMAPLLIAHGVTSVRDMGGDLENMLALRNKFKEPGVVAPRLWIAGLGDGSPQVFKREGADEFMKQFPTMPKKPIDTPEAAVAFVDRMVLNGVHFIKTYEMLRPEVFAALVERAHYHGLRVDGHIPQRMTTREAIAAGIDGIVHLKGTDYGCARDPEGLRDERVAIMDAADESEHGAYLWLRVINISGHKAMAQQDPARCDELVELFARKGIWHTPGISTEAFLSKSREEIMHYEDLDYVPIIAKLAKLFQYGKLKGGEYSETSQHMVDKRAWKQILIAKMHKAGVNFLAGTDSPALLLPGSSLHAELEALVDAGLPPLVALQAATINPARFFNVEAKQGSIDVGKVADIVLLNADPLVDINNTRTINTVIAQGQILNRSALDELMMTHVRSK
jgi:imidazolonepropionase-like amidohydrolase